MLFATFLQPSFQLNHIPPLFIVVYGEKKANCMCKNTHNLQDPNSSHASILDLIKSFPRQNNALK